MSRTTPSERLVARLRAQGVDLPASVSLARSYAGRHQRSAGAWSWYVVDDTSGHPINLGSHWPVTTLLRCSHELRVAERERYAWDRDIDPCDACQGRLAQQMRRS